MGRPVRCPCLKVASARKAHSAESGKGKTRQEQGSRIGAKPADDQRVNGFQLELKLAVPIYKFNVGSGEVCEATMSSPVNAAAPVRLPRASWAKIFAV